MADLVDLDVDSLFGDYSTAPTSSNRHRNTDGDNLLLMEEAGDDEDAGAAAANSTRLAGSGGVANADDAEDVEMLERLNKLAKEGAAKRKGAKQPHVKLDANRLLTDRGLPSLLESMQRAPITGLAGRELDDLSSILRAYELWLHRLHPRFAFEDAAERLERLGRQMPMRNALKRMRAGLSPIGVTGLCGGEAEDEEGDTANSHPAERVATDRRESSNEEDESDGDENEAGKDDDEGSASQDEAADAPSKSARANSDSGESFDLQQQQQKLDVDDERLGDDVVEYKKSQSNLTEKTSRRSAKLVDIDDDDGEDQLENQKSSQKKRRRPIQIEDDVSDSEGDGEPAEPQRKVPAQLVDSDGMSASENTNAASSQRKIRRRPVQLADSDGEGDDDSDVIADKAEDPPSRSEAGGRVGRRPAVIDSDED